ncbi:MAG: hypothetical protein CVU71_03730 [Deltaproteobacteria bacterium HGW-Deltaproteobacteria-6]|nr:MAG: hypothetical protein CVU71_03730 [Deltaproteobacteria bacterium HGW-Deltaproteobacteria-6]
MRGGARPGSGPKKGTKYKPRASKGKGKPAVEPKTKKPEVPQDIQDEAALQNMTPLDYMLKVMRDTNADTTRRDRMAQAAAPFVHPRIAEGKGKKGEKENKARQAGAGKFSPGAPPLKLVK